MKTIIYVKAVTLTNFSNLQKLKGTQQQSGGSINIPHENIDTSVYQENEYAHEGVLRSYTHIFPDTYSEMVTAFEELNDAKVKLAKSVLHYMNNMKIQIRFMCIMTRKSYAYDDEDEKKLISVYISYPRL